MAFPLAPLLAIRPPPRNALFHCAPQSLPDVALLARALGVSPKDLRPKHVTLQAGGQNWSLLELSSIALERKASLAFRRLGLWGWCNAERRVFYVTSYPAALRHRFGRWHCSYPAALEPEMILKKIFKPQEKEQNLLWGGLVLDKSDAFLFEKSLGISLGAGLAGPSAARFFCPKPWASPSLFCAQEPTPLQALALKIRSLWTLPSLHLTVQRADILASCPSSARILGLTLPEYLSKHGVLESAQCDAITGQRFVTYKLTLRTKKKPPG